MNVITDKQLQLRTINVAESCWLVVCGANDDFYLRVTKVQARSIVYANVGIKMQWTERRCILDPGG